MMKNRIRLVCSLLVVCLIVTGCNGTITKNIRRDGYAVQDGKFNCGFFISKSKEERAVDKVKYLTDNYIISEKGYIYEITLGGVYSNGMNCKKGGNIGGKVVAIMDQSIVKDSTGHFFYLDTNEEAMKYTRVPESDENYQIYYLLMKDADVKKVVTVNSNIYSYYVLKANGSIHNVHLKKDKDTDKISILSDSEEISTGVYGSIIDFGFAGESLATYFRTSDKFITMKAKNAKDCNKYVDVPCQFGLDEDDVLIEYQDKIVAFNGKTLITDYGRVFTAGS